MADALNPTGHIFEGFWTDWTKGSVQGLTWTLCPTQAIVLTNALAVFVTLCGIQLWTIIRYTLHQWGSSRQPEIATPHLNKQQLILRNASSDLATARLMLALAWTSRRSSGKRSLRAYAIGFWAMVYALLFMCASIFSNKAISAASSNGESSVLLRSSKCGVMNQSFSEVFNPSTVDEFAMFTRYAAKRASELQFSLQYAQACYLSSPEVADMSSTCHTLKAPTVGQGRPYSGSCPFQPQMCHGSAEAMVLDTGDIDTHHQLGINSKPEDRLKYRRVTTCAVLNGTAHIKGWNGTVLNGTSEKPPPETAYAYFGPSLSRNTEWTYSQSNFASFYTNFTDKTTLPYQINVEEALGGRSELDFDPISELAQEDADLQLIFMSYTGMYLGQVDDPWFSAKNEGLFKSSAAASFTARRWAPDQAINTIGCTERHNFCTNDNICTGLIGFEQVQYVDKFNAALTPQQNATFDRVIRAIQESRLWVVIPNLTRTTSPLQATNATMGGVSGAVLSQALPDDQWQRELRFWASISMAQLQRHVVLWATGQIASEPVFLTPPTEPQDIWFCENMMVPSLLYQSFSVLAIILILVFGVLLTGVSLFIEPLARLFGRWFKRPAPSKHWDHDDILELRRNTTSARMSRPPPTPPKDDIYQPSTASYKPALSSRLKSPMWIVCEGMGSSPTLPLADSALRNTDISKIGSLKSPSMWCRRSPWPLRDSWMTISLSNLDLAAPDPASAILDEKDMERGLKPPSRPHLATQRPDGALRRKPPQYQYMPWI